MDNQKYWGIWIEGKKDDDRSLKRDRIQWALRHLKANFDHSSPHEEETHLRQAIVYLLETEAGRETLSRMRRAWYTQKGRLLKQKENIDYNTFTWFLPSKIRGKLTRLSNKSGAYSTDAEIVEQLITDAEEFRRELTRTFKSKQQGGATKKGRLPSISLQKKASKEAKLKEEINQLRIHLKNETLARLRAEATLLKQQQPLLELSDQEELGIIKRARQELKNLTKAIRNGCKEGGGGGVTPEKQGDKPST